MSLKDQINEDLKRAMLAGDKELVTTLRGLKSAILYTELAANKRDEGLGDEVVITLFQKELKKRQESADLYTQGGNSEKANAELAEKSVIQKYLPKQLSDVDLLKLVEEAVSAQPGATMQNMGAIIGVVRQKAGNTVDGSRIAAAVKEKLNP